jgi:hypothetical protein
MRRICRSAGLAITLCAGGAVNVRAQSPPLVFTVAAPERTPSAPLLQASAAIEERGLALWGGSASDFGGGVTVSGPRWTVRSITSLTMLPIDSHGRPTFQQIELVRPIVSLGSVSVAGGGGIRQEWDGTRVLIGRVLAGSDVGPGRLQGSVVLERATSSPVKHDAGDVVMSLGWSRRLGGRISVGFEGVGQDVEGLWNPAEADGGAKLLVGPSLHTRSMSGAWAASLTAGPVVQTRSTVSPPDIAAVAPSSGGHHVGIFVSVSWVPALRR